uniref:Uncharacterized protein n=1 Tax=Anguilla anguilla TaxID=7936 RepID=A0A0E9V292_ANGAN
MHVAEFLSLPTSAYRGWIIRNNREIRLIIETRIKSLLSV